MKIKRMLATTMAATMMLSVTAQAAEAIEWNNDNGESVVVGESTVVQPVLEVALPGDLAFTLDPLYIEGDKQVVGGDYNVINYGNVEVKVTVNPSVITNEVLSIVGTTPALATDNDKKYKDLTPAESGKKAVYLTAIPADKATDIVDANEDGVYEFAYTANTGDVGRAASAGTGEEFKIGAATAGTDTGLQVILNAAAADAKGSANFAFDLKAFNSEKEILGSDNAASISSFTIGGAVDPTVTYEDGDVNIQAVYTMEVLTADEKKTIEDKGNASGGVSDNKHQMIVK